MRRIWYFLFSMGFLIMCGTAVAQVGTQGSITGTVTDISGAVIPGASITAVQAATQLERTSTADGKGSFEIQALPIGIYSVTVTAPGMKAWKVDHLELTIGASLKISPELQVGSVNQQVTVHAHQTLQTETTSANTVLDVPTLLNYPNSVRNPVSLVELVPGMRYDGASGPEGGAFVHGMGLRSNAASFSLDGINVNAPMDSGAIGIPVMDDIAEISVETANASASMGRDPIQVKLVTKSGTNQFHGSAWEFFQNDALNAYYAFASKKQPKPHLRFNQFGGNAGGPILHNRLFFFGSFQASLSPNATVYSEFAPLATNYDGNFPTGVVVKDPLTGLPFPNGPAGGSSIPADRINPASKFFIPFLLVGQPNGSGGSIYQDQAPSLNKIYQSSLRLDYYISRKQRIYVRNIALQSRSTSSGYTPSFLYNNSLDQDTLGVNYTYTITPNLLFTATAGFIQTANWFSSPNVGKTNYSLEAGIQGIPTAGRECCIGLPQIYLGGTYPGISLPFGLNGKLWGDVPDANATITLVKRGHTIGVGYELQDNQVYGRHSSGYGTGFFGFYGAYTGNPLGDFLLGYAGAGLRNLPLNTFGLDRSFLSAIHAEDSWKVRSNLTLNLGLRYEYWPAPHFIAGNASTWDPSRNTIIAGTDNGKLNLTQQPSAAFVAAATAGLWESQTDAGIKHMIPGNGHLEPRIGIAWQPNQQQDVVLRAAYGVYENNFTGNRAASDIGAIPFFSLQETQEGTTPVDYRTMFSANPSDFTQPSVNYTTSLHINEAKTQEWNLSFESALPLNSTLTLGYIGVKAMGQPFAHDYNSPPPGKYTNLAAAQLHPAYGVIYVMENGIDTWYHGLQAQWEHRNHNGLYYMVSYMWSKSMSNHAYADGELSLVDPYAPAWYERGISPINNTNNLKVAAVYQLPIGRSRRVFSNMNRIADAVVGGWELGGYYSFISGDPLSISMTGVTLGNNYNTRADLVGNPHVGNPSRTKWFNTAAFAAAPEYQFGNSPIGVVNGPNLNVVNLSLLKNFSWRPGDYLQIRIDAFNALNHTNLNDPDVTFGSPTFGQILAGGAARTVQLGAKIVF